MIKEYWQERKEEKKRLKQIKKQNKKLPATKEQKAYKVFGVIFVLFLIFGSIFYTCSGLSDMEGYSWDKLSGITEEMKVKLEQPVDRKDLIVNKQIDVVDWSYCKDALISSGVGGVIIDNKIDSTIVSGKTQTLSSTLTFDNSILGALSQKLIESSVYSDDIELIEVVITYEDDKIMLSSLVMINLATVVLGDNPPSVYVTTESTIEILNNKMYALNSTCRINNLSDSDNLELLEVINKNSFTKLEFYSNELIARQINSFAEGVNAIVRINNSSLELD